MNPPNQGQSHSRMKVRMSKARSRASTRGASVSKPLSAGEVDITLSYKKKAFRASDLSFLTDSDVDNDHPDDEGRPSADLLKVFLKRHSEFNCADFSKRPLSLQDCIILRNILANNTSLFEIDLSQCGLASEHMALIVHGLMENKTVLRLNLSRNNIGDDAGRLIILALNRNCTLLSLELNADKINVPTKKNIYQLIERNVTARINLDGCLFNRINFCLLGSAGVGKTSLLEKLVDRDLSHDYHSYMSVRRPRFKSKLADDELDSIPDVSQTSFASVNNNENKNVKQKAMDQYIPRISNWNIEIVPKNHNQPSRWRDTRSFDLFSMLQNPNIFNGGFSSVSSSRSSNVHVRLNSSSNFKRAEVVVFPQREQRFSRTLHRQHQKAEKERKHRSSQRRIRGKSLSRNARRSSVNSMLDNEADSVADDVDIQFGNGMSVGPPRRQTKATNSQTKFSRERINSYDPEFDILTRTKPLSHPGIRPAVVGLKGSAMKFGKRLASVSELTENSDGDSDHHAYAAARQGSKSSIISGASEMAASGALETAPQSAILRFGATSFMLNKKEEQKRIPLQKSMEGKQPRLLAVNNDNKISIDCREPHQWSRDQVEKCSADSALCESLNLSGTATPNMRYNASRSCFPQSCQHVTVTELSIPKNLHPLIQFFMPKTGVFAYIFDIRSKSKDFLEMKEILLPILSQSASSGSKVLLVGTHVEALCDDVLTGSAKIQERVTIVNSIVKSLFQPYAKSKALVTYYHASGDHMYFFPAFIGTSMMRDNEDGLRELKNALETCFDDALTQQVSIPMKWAKAFLILHWKYCFKEMRLYLETKRATEHFGKLFRLTSESQVKGMLKYFSDRGYISYGSDFIFTNLQELLFMMSNILTPGMGLLLENGVYGRLVNSRLMPDFHRLERYGLLSVDLLSIVLQTKSKDNLGPQILKHLTSCFAAHRWNVPTLSSIKINDLEQDMAKTKEELYFLPGHAKKLPYLQKRLSSLQTEKQWNVCTFEFCSGTIGEVALQRVVSALIETQNVFTAKDLFFEEKVTKAASLDVLKQKQPIPKHRSLRKNKKTKRNYQNVKVLPRKVSRDKKKKKKVFNSKNVNSLGVVDISQADKKTKAQAPFKNDAYDFETDNVKVYSNFVHLFEGKSEEIVVSIFRTTVQRRTLYIMVRNKSHCRFYLNLIRNSLDSMTDQLRDLTYGEGSLLWQVKLRMECHRSQRHPFYVGVNEAFLEYEQSKRYFELLSKGFTSEGEKARIESLFADVYSNRGNHGSCGKPTNPVNSLSVRERLDMHLQLLEPWMQKEELINQLQESIVEFMQNGF